MSMTGSLISYENGNDCSKAKSKQRIQVTTGANNISSLSKSSEKCFRVHGNSLWSIWYGLCLTGFQVYLAISSAKKFLGYASLPWPNQLPPRLELNACVAFIGISIIILPFFLITTIIKVGNLANDGFKLGRNLSTCAADPPTSLVGSNENQGVFRSLWQYGGPTAPFLHLTAAFGLLLPKLLMEARLIQAGFLPKDALWKTDLDFILVHHDRLVVLNFMTSPPTFSNSTFYPTAQSFSTTIGDLEQISSLSGSKAGKEMDLPHFADNSKFSSLSLEFVNYATALLVYAVRYPSVFWNTNKCFGALFSFQLLANGIQNLLSYAGISVLYKIQIIGASESLPLLKRYSYIGTPLLLDAYITLGLFVLSSILVLSSSLVLYLYGYGKFNAFLNKEREKRIIILKEGKNSDWGYFTHCAALSVLLALAVCHAPLLHDFTVIYRGSLDGVILTCVIAAVLHLLLWVLVWLILTVKQKWTFHLRVTIGRAALRSTRSIKLVTDVDLVSSTKHADEAAAPLLVVGGGRTFTVSDPSPKKAIINVIQKLAMERKSKISAQGCGSTQEFPNEDTEIYWLRPKPCSPKYSPSDSEKLHWFSRKLSLNQKQKVTFHESLSRGSSDETKERMKNSEVICEDDGDYATLRVGPSEVKIVSDNISEENKLLEHALQDDNVTFARSSELQPDYEDPSPLLTPEPSEMPLPPPPTELNQLPAVVVRNNSSIDKTVNVTPKCLKRADSGMPNEELTPRSGSVSSGSQSVSGSSPPGTQNSESSSGVHSNSSSRRATSVDDLTVQQDTRQTQWKSCSLQRNVLPPSTPCSTSIYSCTQNLDWTQSTVGTVSGVILENPAENTVVIRRKSTRPLTADLSRPPELKEEPFGRSTNMRMTSFTDEGSSATLPHFPTQTPPTSIIYPCNTMPLPCSPNPPTAPIQQCNAFPRPHTTIPIHHNGVRLFPTTYAKRLQFTGIPRLPKHNRDSANFSMASSGDSDSHS